MAIDQPDEVLPILIFDESNSWEAVLELGQPHLDRKGLDRIQSSVSAAKTVVFERHYLDKDYRETFSNYHSRKFHTPDARCLRLHFFKDAVGRSDLPDPERLQPNYLGYSVIRPIRPNCIGRTLLAPQARCGVNGMLAMCQERVNLQGTELKIAGFPFISQDAETTVCAQATLWMVLRYFSNRFPIYPEMYPVRIGDLTRDYSVGRLFPTGGLFVWQMAEALRQAGFGALIYSRSQYPQNFEHLLYTYIESGIPVLAAFKNHVVVLFGHESDYSDVSTIKPDSESPFVFSSAFNRGFIGNDDNGIPYQALRQMPQGGDPWGEMHDENRCYSIEGIEHFVVPLPERVYLNAESFQNLVTTLLEGKEFGYSLDSPFLKDSGPPLLRIFLTTGKSFKQQIQRRKGMGHPTVASVYRDLPLPHFLWVCEFSTPSQYPNEVLGEVLWDATRNPYEDQGVLAIHYPEKMMVDWGSALNGSPDILYFSLDDWAPYPVFSHNLKKVGR